MSPLDLAGRIGLALALAVFMGLAFEGIYKREQRTSPGGIRTFPMLALLGALLYLLEPRALLPFLAGLASLGAWLFARLRAEPPGESPGASFMVPAANLLAYCFGPLAITQAPWIVVAAAVTAVLLLEGREFLHRLVRRVSSEEVFTLGKFLILTGVVLPLLPDHPIVRWTAITPFDAWLALVAVSTLSYLSYLAQLLLPARAGVLWSAVLGGLYSSTATTVALARQMRELHVKSGTRSPELAAGIVLATGIMYLRIGAAVAVFNGALALKLLPALLALAALAAAVCGFLWRYKEPNRGPTIQKLPSSNPLQLGAAVTFALLFVLLTLATGWVRARFGPGAIYALALITGLADVDPFVLSLAQGSAAGMSSSALAAAILIAGSSNNVLKALYALIFGGRRAALIAVTGLIALAAIGFALAALYLRAGATLW